LKFQRKYSGDFCAFSHFRFGLSTSTFITTSRVKHFNTFTSVRVNTYSQHKLSLLIFVCTVSGTVYFISSMYLKFIKLFFRWIHNILLLIMSIFILSRYTIMYNYILRIILIYYVFKLLLFNTVL
jgi:hypothetical protein